MTTDDELLAHYLALNEPDAARWNLSIPCLELEVALRRALEEHVRPAPGCLALNVGIGTGTWDDYLGYWLEERGVLVSVDRDPAVCRVFRYRQAREGHPNPARVLTGDLLEHPLRPGAFDLVTVVGTTASESGDAGRLYSRSLEAVKPGGECLVSQVELADQPPAGLDLMATESSFDWRDVSAAFDGASSELLRVRLLVGRRR